jgi:AraC-like DNA-binding protein
MDAAARALGEMPADAIAVLGPDGPRGPAPRTAPTRPLGRLGGGIHAHACIEVCFAVGGPSRLWTAGGPLELRPGSLAIIPPHTPHCEGWRSKAAAYRLLWLVLIGGSLSAFISSYSPRRGWRVTARASAIVSATEPLSRAIRPAHSHRLPDAAACHMLRGALLLLLGEMMAALAEPDPAPPDDRQHRLTDQVKTYIELHYAERLTVGSLATLFRLSPNYLNGLFSRHHGIGIRAYLLRQRLQAARRMLTEGHPLVKEVAYTVGFADPLYFSRLFHRRFGRPPSAVRDA